MRPPESSFGDSIEPDALSGIISPAQPESRPILIYVHADWCADCPDFEKRLAQPNVQTALVRFKKFHYNATAASAWPALAALGIESVPALIVIEAAPRKPGAGGSGSDAAHSPRGARRVLAAYSRIPESVLQSFLEAEP